AFGDGLFVAGGGRGTFVSSTDGVAWRKEATIEGVYGVVAILFDGSRFIVAVEGDGKAATAAAPIYVAPAKRPLVFAPLSPTPIVSPRVRTGTVFYGTSERSIFRSTDLLSWTKLHEEPSYVLGDVASCGGILAVIGTYPPPAPLAPPNSVMIR